VSAVWFGFGFIFLVEASVEMKLISLPIADREVNG